MSNKESLSIDEQDRKFEIAHSQGNGLMARDEAGVQVDIDSRTPRDILASDDPDKYIKLGRIMSQKTTSVTSINQLPQTYRPSTIPLGWRDRRRT